jgi:hypothetical protein
MRAWLAFGGSFSLKAVLPALVPEMTYEGMEVSNGQSLCSVASFGLIFLA